MDLNTKCWICGTEYQVQCPKCGAPQPFEPTPGELLLEIQQELYGDDPDADELFDDDKTERDDILDPELDDPELEEDHQ